MTSLLRDFPHFLHGADYNPDQWIDAPGVLDEDFRLIHAAGCNTMAIGIFAWSRLEPEEGVYDFGWMDGLAEQFQTNGVNLILATPSGAKPFWLSEKYEEVRRVDRKGVREISGGRHNHCWTSPVFRKKVRAINTLLGTRYGSHPALKLWHVSNEYNGECYCPLCLTRFRDWLKDRYQSLAAINRAYWSDFWAHRFTAWEQINPRNGVLDGLVLDWKRFVSWQVEDFYLWEIEPLKKTAPSIPAFTNLMGLFPGVDYRRLARHMDLVGDDSYPNYDGDDPEIADYAAWHGMKFDALRCLTGKPKAWFLMEACIDGRQIWGDIKLKHPGMHHLEMLQAVAHGAEGTLYFQWRKGRGGLEKFHGAVLHHNHPEETRSFREVQSLGQRYRDLEPVLGSLGVAEVALLLDWESRWAWNCSLGVPDREDPYALVNHAARHYRPYWRRGVSVDVLDSTDDFSGYRLVLVPRLYLLKKGVAKKLKAFVASGGTVVMTAISGMVNETNLCLTDGWPGNGLEELVGGWMEEIDRLKPGQVRYVKDTGTLGLEGTWTAGPVCTRLHAHGAEPILQYSDNWMAGTPAALRNSFGKGTAYFFGCDTEAEDAIHASILREAGLTAFHTDHSPLPAGVSAIRRRSPAGDYWFLMNFSLRENSVSLPKPGGQDIETTEELNCARLAPWEVRVIRTNP